MMQRVYRYIYCLIIGALTLAAASCRTNNGDIGHLYGEWVLTEVDTKTLEPTDYLRFQNDIVEITVVSDHHDSLVAFGRWRRDGDNLTLDFSGNLDADGNLKPNTALGWLGETGETVFRCEIVTETRRTLVLKVADPNGGTVNYLYEKVI